MRTGSIIASVIIPIAVLMVIGYILRRRGIVTQQGAKDFNKIVFKCLLPANLFMNVATSSFHEAMNPKLIVFCAVGLLALYAALIFMVPKLCPDRRRVPVIVQGIHRANYAIFGLVVIEGFFPEQVGMASVVSAFVIPIYNVLAVILLESADGGKADLKKTLLGVAKNPLIIAIVLGLIVALTGLKLPALVTTCLNNLSKCSSPAGLLAIGMGFGFSTLRKNARALTATVLVKLLLVPALFCVLGMLLGLKDAEMMILLIVFGAPTAVSSYPMAQMYDVDHDLANQIVVGTTICCIFSLSLLIWLLTLTPFMTLI